MGVLQFRPYWEAPEAIRYLDANCGPTAAWGVLRYFRKRVAAHRLIKACRHTKRHGTFSIALAIALKEHGLDVQFYSEPDPNPTAIEKRCYRRAEEIGIQFAGAVALDTILDAVNSASVPIILFNTENDVAHLSPIAGIEDGLVSLPYTDEGRMAKQELEARWTASEIYRQCVVARPHRKPRGLGRE